MIKKLEKGKHGSNKFSYEYVKNYFEENGCELLSKEYINNLTKLKYICICGEKSEITLQNFKTGQRCKKCAIKRRANQKG